MASQLFFGRNYSAIKFYSWLNDKPSSYLHCGSSGTMYLFCFFSKQPVCKQRILNSNLFNNFLILLHLISKRDIESVKDPLSYIKDNHYYLKYNLSNLNLYPLLLMTSFYCEMVDQVIIYLVCTEIFPKNQHFLPRDTYVCVSGGKKC